MSVVDDGFYLVEQVRRLIVDRPLGQKPWRAEQILGAIERAARHGGDHERFYLAFLEGVRDIVPDDEDAVLARFMRQAAGSEARSLADAETDRDHLTHVTQVFLLGWLILNRCAKLQTLADWEPYGWSRGERFERLNQAWIYASLLHDCAYSAQNAKDSVDHEIRVRAMFGRMYRPGTPGSVEPSKEPELTRALWDRRACVIERKRSKRVDEVLRKIYEYPDHGLFTAQALMEEASHHEARVRETLEVGAISLVTHNFRHSIDPQESPDPDIVAWLSVDFWQEPLAALLTVADEIQEWGRERADAAGARETWRKGFLRQRTVLTDLAVDAADGLRIRAEIHHLLFPEDRENRLRLARDREMALAKDNRTYKNAFLPRTARADLHLHLRIDEIVEGVPCGIARQYDWPAPGRDHLVHRSHLALDAWKRPAAWTSVEATVVGDRISSGGPPSTVMTADGPGSAKLHDLHGGDRGLRIVLVAPGGAGKSTLLRALAGASRIGRRRLRTLYVDELDEPLCELVDVCSELRGGSEDVVLIVDHLDRLLRTPHETFWFEQLRALPDDPWLHVVAACRPEEFHEVVHFTLGKRFVRASMTGGAGPLMESTDGEGRVTVRALERHLRGAESELDRLGDLALSMKARRFVERPEVQSTATFAGEPLVRGDLGRVRFTHDAIQDGLSARVLVRDLIASDTGGDTEARSWRELLACPPDVFRFALERIADRSILQGVHATRAARGLALALGREPTIRHWLYDMGHLARSRAAIEALAERFGGDQDAAFAAHMLLGLERYQRFLPTDLGDGDRAKRSEHQAIARECVDAFATAIGALDRSSLPIDGPLREGLTLYLLDHLVTIIARTTLLSRDPALPHELADRARRQLEDVARSSGSELGPAWARSVVERLDPDADACVTLERIDHDLEKRIADDREAAAHMEMRRYQIAGHIGGTHLLRAEQDQTSLRLAMRWQERAVSRAMRVVRAMQGAAHRHEQFGTLAHGLNDAARHQAALVYFWVRALHGRIGATADARYRLLDAIARYETARRAAQIALRPGERLSIANWHGLQDQVLGQVFRKAFGKGGMTVEQAREALAKAHEEVNQHNRRFARHHVREEDGEDYLSYYEKRIGSPAEFIARWAGPSSHD